MGQQLYTGQYWRCIVPDFTAFFLSGESCTDEGTLWESYGICRIAGGRDRLGFILVESELYPYSFSQKAKKVYGVEIVPQAIEDARHNAKLNGIENAEFFSWEKRRRFFRSSMRRTMSMRDVIVVDPPRKGCGRKPLRYHGTDGAGENRIRKLWQCHFG